VLRTNVRRGDSIHRSGGGSLTTRRRRRRGTCNALVESGTFALPRPRNDTFQYAHMPGLVARVHPSWYT
jgi:hypothetical protein